MAGRGLWDVDHECGRQGMDRGWPGPQWAASIWGEQSPGHHDLAERLCPAGTLPFLAESPAHPWAPWAPGLWAVP